MDIEVEIVEPDSRMVLAGFEKSDRWLGQVAGLDKVGQGPEGVDSWQALGVQQCQQQYQRLCCI